MWKRLQKETHPFILYNDQDSEGATNLKDLKNITVKSMPQTGRRTYLSKSRGNLSRNPTFVIVNSVGAARWLEVEQKLEFLAILFLDWTVEISQFRDVFFSLAEKWIPWQSTGGVDRYTCRTPHFHMYSHSRTSRVPKRSFIHASCFTLCSTRHWALPLRLSLLPLQCCCRLLLRTQTCCPRIQLSTEDPRQDGTSAEYSSSAKSTVNHSYGSSSGTTGQGEFSEWFQGVLWSWSGKQLWIIPRSQSASEYSESSWSDKPRFLPPAWYTEHIGYIGERCWKSTCTRWTDSILFRKCVSKKSYQLRIANLCP